MSHASWVKMHAGCLGAEAAGAASAGKRAELEAALAEMGRWAEGEKGANQALWSSLQAANRRASAAVRALRITYWVLGPQVLRAPPGAVEQPAGGHPVRVCCGARCARYSFFFNFP